MGVIRVWRSRIHARLRRPTALELFVSCILLVTLSSCVWDKYTKWRECRWYDQAIKSFSPQGPAESVLPGDRILADADLTGRWEMRGRRVGSYMQFLQAVEGDPSVYRVDFSTHTCTTTYSLTRRAGFREGRVLLDRPVAQADGQVYQELYCVRVGGTKVLVPASRRGDSRLLGDIELAECRNEWSGLEALVYVHALRSSIDGH